MFWSLRYIFWVYSRNLICLLFCSRTNQYYSQSSLEHIEALNPLMRHNNKVLFILNHTLCPYPFSEILPYFFWTYKPIFFIKDPILIHSSSDSEESEEFPKYSVICLITFVKCIYTLLKILTDNSFHLSWERNWSWLLL